GGGQRGGAAARDQAGGDRARDGAVQEGVDQPAHDVHGGGVRAEEGRGRATHAVLPGLPAAVLLPDDGRDRDGDVAGRDRDGDAWRQHQGRRGAGVADRV